MRNGSSNTFMDDDLAFDLGQADNVDLQVDDHNQSNYSVTEPLSYESLWGEPPTSEVLVEDYPSKQNDCPIAGLKCEHWYFGQCEFGRCLLNLDS